MIARTRPSRGRDRRGFTLLELLVVTLIIAVLASLAIPRFSSTTQRTFDLAVEQVGDLLVMFAQRDTLGRHPVGLTYDEPRRRLMLVVLDRDSPDADSVTGWRPDALVRPVSLPREVDASSLLVIADGEYVDVRQWPLSHTPGEDRPSIQISLQSSDGAMQATLQLAPHAVVPRRLGETDLLSARARVDLDAAGRSREDW